jgi:hypothetical protein
MRRRLSLPSDRVRATCTVALTLIVLVAVSSFLLPVVPWPRDHWFESQYLIFGSHAESDNYSPIAAPAFLYAGIHWIASVLNLELREEFYLASVLQNGMLLCSVLMIYATMRKLQLPRPALISIASMCFILSTGLPQTFNSENVCLFLTALLLYSSANVCQAKFVPFFAITVVIGATVGLLVLTRVIPVIFIPGVIFLFSKRFEPKRLLIFGGTVTALTVAMLLWLVSTNHDRFGRFELTGSSGRHLWQGAKEITDRALDGVPEYQALKRADPEIGGTPREFLPWNTGRDHWNVPYPDEVVGLEHFQSPEISRERQKDALLKMLAIEAIRSKPILYLASGASKFLGTIGGAPYQLGFLYRAGFYNPLRLSEPLPPLASLLRLVPDGATAEFRKLLDTIHRAGQVLYPWAICFLSVSLLAMYGLSYLIRHPYPKAHPQRRPRDIFEPRRLHLILFGTSALGIAVIVCLLPGLSIEGSVALVLCIAMIVALSRVLATLTRQLKSGLISEVRSTTHQRLYVCLAILFFVSMWISWQVEVALSRYAISYLPMLMLMLGIAVGFWQSIFALACNPAESDETAVPA